MGHMFRVSLALICLSLCPAGSDADPPEEDPLRRRRLELLESKIAEFAMRIDEEDAQPLARGKTPILRWSNPVRDFVNDGIIYLWLDGKRPVAVVTYWVRSTEANLQRGELWHEFVSLSAKPLILSREDQVLWRPRTGGVVNQPVPEAPVPQDLPARRLAQMRDIARQFQASSYKMGSPHELRLLTQPLYRYEDSAAGILDGALFAFAEGNDPEVLLLVEASAGDDGKSQEWRYTLARSTSYRVTVQLDDREVFAVEPYWKAPRSPSDPYVGASDGPFDLETAAPAEPKSKSPVAPK